MRATLSLFVLGLPIIELVGLIAMGSAFGLIATLLWILATGVLGVWVLRVHGPRTMDQAMREAARQESAVSGGQALDMLAMGLAGVMLVIPGPLTDALGLLLLIGPLRRWMLAAWLGSLLRDASVRRYDGDGVIIEGEVVRERDEDKKPDRHLE
ncbi:MAG: FxsA family protein [Halothiobacillaceae bacterium]